MSFYHLNINYCGYKNKMNNYLYTANFKGFSKQSLTQNSFNGNSKVLKLKNTVEDTFTRISSSPEITFKGIDENLKLKENIQLAQETMDYVKSLNLKSNTKMEMLGQDCGEFTEKYEDAINNRMFLDKKRDNLPIDEYIAVTKKSAPMLEVGNCSEQAILAATFLKEQKNINNFALVTAVGVQNKEAFDENPIKYAFLGNSHVFLVLDLAPDAKINDPATWGKNAVVIDPWGDISGPAINKETPEESGINKVKKLQIFNRGGNIEFMNYASFIDPTKDQESAYNWENYQRKNYE